MPVFEIYKKYMFLQWSSIEKLETRQNKSLSGILEYAVSNLKFYEELLTDDNVHLIHEDPKKSLSLFSVLTKDDLRINRDFLYVEKGLGTFVNRLGGTTGEPVEVALDNVFQSSLLASTYTMFEWAGKSPGDRLVKLWGAERDLVTVKSWIKEFLSRLIGNNVVINSFKMKACDLHRYVKTLNENIPVCIEGYAYSIYSLAKHISKNDLDVHAPKSIVTSAGVLYPHMRKEIEDVFNAPVFDRYGSRDAGNNAAECSRYKGLHIFAETTFIEVVYDQGHEVGVGEEGHVLVTNLCNYKMPLIRYKIGDKAIKGKRCTFGRPYPILESITGRSASDFKTKDGGYVSVVTFIHIVGVMYNDGSIRKFQIVQENIDRVIIKIILDQQYDFSSWKNKDLIAKAIIKAIIKAMGECSVGFLLVDDIPPTSAGKHLYTIREVEK